MPEFSQENRYLKITTPLKGESLLLRSFEGVEEMSNPFRFSLDMLATDPALDMSKLVGQPVTVSVPLTDDKIRYFHGKVLQIAGGELVYAFEKQCRQFRAEVVPNLWFLKFNSNCRIFQNKKIPEIIEQVCKDAKFADLKLQLKGDFQKLDYCVQYNESDFQFVTRLMEKAGIYYYFAHEEGKHLTVLGDRVTAYAKCLDDEVDHADRFDMKTAGEVHSWERQLEFTSGKFAQTDYNFETSNTKLHSKVSTIVPIKGHSAYEVYEYPGGYSNKGDAIEIVKARIEELEVPHETVRGDSNCAGFSPGGKFKIKAHPVKTEQNKSYMLVAVHHRASDLGVDEGRGSDAHPYTNNFRCIPAKTLFRPPRTTPAPRMYGLQTARVVGPGGEEILTDKYGRVKVQFHWDREGKNDEKSSCWVRVAQFWAGAKRGSLFTPRVGDEVVVDFLEGDPDRPLIVGSVYNDANLPPFELPSKSSHSGFKTHSTEKGKAKDFNELRFEDTKEKELIYFHAQKDFVRVVENDDKLKVGFDAKKNGDQTVDIFNNRTVTIDEGFDQLQIKTGKRDVKIDNGNLNVTVSKGDRAVKIEAGKSSLEAAKEILLKVGSNSIKIDQKGVTIVGMEVAVEGKVGVDIKATMVKVKGSAMTNIKGGLVKIN